MGCAFFVGYAFGPTLQILNVSPTPTSKAPVSKPSIDAIGFLPFWLVKDARPENGTLTEIAYFSLTLSPDGSITRLLNPREQEPGYTMLGSSTLAEWFSALESGVRRSIVIHLSDENDIITLIQDPQVHANTLIEDVVPIMDTYGFEDLNLDIESYRIASDSDRIRFTEFVSHIRNLLPERTLTLELGPSAFSKPYIFDPGALGAIVDRVVLMAYDYKYRGSLSSGPVAPIGGAGKDREEDIGIFLARATTLIPKEKLILGIPLYGYEWETIASIPGAATIPGGASTASLRRIASIRATCDESCKEGYDMTAQTPYLIFQDPVGQFYHQIFFENDQSIMEKITLAKSHGLAGVAYWAIGYESGALPVISE